MSFTLTLAVAELSRTAVFYGEILQLPVEKFVPLPGHPPVLLLQAGDAVVLFRDSASFEARHPALFSNLDRYPRGIGMLLEFPVPSLRPVQKSLERYGIHVLYELEDDEFGRRELWVHDPDGYLLALRQESRPELA